MNRGNSSPSSKLMIVPDAAPDGEQDREHLRPAARERPPHRIAGAQVHALGDEHHQRQAHAEDREEQVEAQRGADLAAAGGEVREIAASGN